MLGGYFGSGRHGGEVAQFLMGLAERSAPDTYPKRFISFCRVGTGLSDDELHALVTKLKPFFRKNEHSKKAPRFYEVTNNSKERPDVWIDSPDKSIILSITSDIRTIKSEVFAAPYSLRFPRIQRVRYDKPWHECLDIQSFADSVNSSNGNTHRHTDHGGIQVYQSKKVRSSRRGEKKTAAVVPAHFRQTDVSDVKEETFIFSNMMVYIVNVPVSYSVDYFHKLVAENGGTFSMNLNDSVTHCIAAEKKGIKYQAAMRYGDIIHYSWVLDCCSQKRLLHLQPKYFLFLSDSSKNKFQEEIDAFSDYYYWDIDITDIKQMFSNIQGSADLKVIDYYKKKYCPMEKWLLFQDCCIYFCHPLESINDEQKLISELSLRRLKLEATIGGGEVSNNLSRATHLVSYSTMESDADFGRIYESFPSAERWILRNKQLHVVRHQWMEDSLERGKKLAEDPYNVRPAKFEDLFVEQRALDLEDPATSGVVDNKGFLLKPDRDQKRRRGRPASTNVKRGSTATKPVQRKRARIGNRAAKIDTNVSDDTESSEEHGRREEIRSSKDSHPIQEFTMEEKVELSKKQKLLVDESKELKIQDKGDENNGFGDNKRYKGLAKAKEIEGLESGSTEKLEVMIDPVQAMLLDMIPSLSQTKAEAGKSTIEDKKPVNEVKEPDPNPVKKKKVSYKDVANDLLKDW
ncbi:DNA ligase 4 [Acorus calamus]|uniref:DNA ligase 4 n=1 Tax=Acorus calamus TaxID=4465 RepID=A0AAV9CN20_ACOCL|nr:DNA ligase 4 [Acorus calamus]